MVIRITMRPTAVTWMPASHIPRLDSAARRMQNKIVRTQYPVVSCQQRLRSTDYGPRSLMRLSFKLGALCAAAAFVPVILIFTIVSSQVSSHARGQALEQLRSDAR